MDYFKIDLPGHKKANILALGAQSKGSFCFIKNAVLYPSKFNGDLTDLKNLRSFKRRIKLYGKDLGVKPEIIACDLHPEYISTKLGNEMIDDKRTLIAIQHHESHIASCVLDNNIKGRVIGVAFDGTGFGTDGNIWGGEFFVGGIRSFKRAAHLEYIHMPGGEASVREPYRMALSYLYKVYKKNFKDLDIEFIERLDKNRIELLIQAIDKEINSPLTSSVGRLFDAISSLIGLCDVAHYEAQPAVELEKAIQGAGYRVPASVDRQGTGGYRFKYIERDGVIIIDWRNVIKGVVKDLEGRKSREDISLKFHNAVCEMIKDVCNLLRKKYKVSKVSLSGGVFQNRYITTQTRTLLEREGFSVYLHKRFPAHDGNIAIGQAIIAYMRG